jgi:hypothetical protein
MPVATRRVALLLGIAVGLVVLVLVLPSILAIVLSGVFGFVAGGNEILRGTACVPGLAILLMQRRFAGCRRLPVWALAGAFAGSALLVLWQGAPDPPNPAPAAWVDLAWLLLFALWSAVGSAAWARRWDGPLLGLLFATTRTGLLATGAFIAFMPGPGDPPGIEPAVMTFVLMGMVALGAFVLVALVAAAIGGLLLVIGERRGRWLAVGLCLADAAWQLATLL